MSKTMCASFIKRLIKSSNKELLDEATPENVHTFMERKTLYY